MFDLFATSRGKHDDRHRSCFRSAAEVFDQLDPVHFRHVRVSDENVVWIVRGLGYGLDEKAAQSVLQYQFRPQSCHDKAEPVEIYIDVNFQIF